MSHKLAQELRESAKATFYDPLKSELNRAADCIDKLTLSALEARHHCVKSWKENGERNDDQLGVVALILSNGLGEICSD